ncbi:HotDog domain-containing protein [Xylariaceae sp. FL0255]|nr:HotDog domain-containing protein [Xylariaceae sp. FL0255]
MVAQPPTAPLSSEEEYFISQGITILQDPSTVSFLLASRLGTEGSRHGDSLYISQDRLFRRLLNTETAIPHLIGFYRNPFSGAIPTFPDLPFIVNSMTFVFDVSKDLHGFNGTVHGGIIGALMDEAMGNLLFQNDLLNREAKANGSIPGDSPGFSAAGTADMEVKYLRPIPTPNIILATATLIRKEDRKMSMRVVVANKDGKEYAIGKGTFVTLKKAKM